MDNALNKVIAFLSALCILIGLLIGSVFLLPVSFAADMTNQPLNSGDIFYNGSGRTVALTTGSSVFVSSFYTPDSGSSVLPLYCISPIEQVAYFNRSNDSNTFSVSISYPVTGSSLFYGISYSSAMYLHPNSSSISVPVFNSFDDMISFVNGYLPSNPSLYENFNIPIGYAARIRIGSGDSFSARSIIPSESDIFTGGFHTSQKYIFSDSADSSIISSASSSIPWSAYGDLDIFGQTNKGEWVVENVPSGTYLWIINPVYASSSIQSNNPWITNNVITLSNVVGIDQIRLFSLSSSLGGLGVINNTPTGSAINVVPTSDGAFSYEDSDGNSIELKPYGDTAVNNERNIFQVIENSFNNLISRIEVIFHGTAVYFQRFLNALSDFASWLGQLWSWLPAPLSALIEAVIYISILVGLIKLLLR